MATLGSKAIEDKLMSGIEGLDVGSLIDDAELALTDVQVCTQPTTTHARKDTSKGVQRFVELRWGVAVACVGVPRRALPCVRVEGAGCCAPLPLAQLLHF
jgi:hypothetical protein